MDKKTILSDGLLEQYILGELSPEKSADLERILSADDELRSLFNEIEEDFEKLGLENFIKPPEQVKRKVLDNIKSNNTHSNPIKLKSEPKKSFKFFFQLAAAIATLFMLSTFYLIQEKNTLTEELKTVKASTIEEQDKTNNLNSELSKVNTLLAFLSDVNTDQYILNGNELMPEARLVTYVNHKEKKVLVNTEKLPNLKTDEDYQLWADVEGKMISMGVIPKSKKLSDMTYIEHAESLNITLEPKGGSEHPTVSRLISNAYLK